MSILKKKKKVKCQKSLGIFMRNMVSLIYRIFYGKKRLRSYYTVARYKLQDHGNKVKNVGT